MDERNFLLNFYERFQSDNPFDFEKEHFALISEIHNVLEKWHIRSPKGPFWQELVEPLTLKLSFVSSSFENLIIRGTVHGRHSDNPLQFPDLSSIYTLGRGQLEAYLTFFYLYVQPQSEDESKLRYWLYVIHSLTVRQTANTDSLPVEMQKRKLEEAQRIEDYKKKVEANSVFQNYSSSNKGRLLSGRTAKEIGWEKLIDAAKLKAIGVKTYDLYANHAHCEYMSLIQLRAVLLHPDETRPLIANAMKTSLMLLSLFLRQLSSLVGLTDIYNLMPIERKMGISLWSGILLGETIDISL